MSFLNFLGVALVLAGGVFYARYEAIDDEERNPGGGSGGGGAEDGLLPMKLRREDPIEEKGRGNWWGGGTPTIGDRKG